MVQNVDSQLKRITANPTHGCFVFCHSMSFSPTQRPQKNFTESLILAFHHASIRSAHLCFTLQRLIMMSSMMDDRQSLEQGMLEIEGFELVLSRKIEALKAPLLYTFMRLDIDGDGCLSKEDLQKALSDLFDMDLKEDQIDSIFIRAVLLRNLTETQIKEGRNPDESPRNDETLITFPTFQKYIHFTASNTSQTSSRIHGSNFGIEATVKKREKLSKFGGSKSAIFKTKKLRSIVRQLIQQNVPPELSHRAATFTFLELDTDRNNQVTRAEFRDWLKEVHGLTFTEEEMKLIFGRWQKEEGLELKEFVYYIDCLLSEYVPSPSKKSDFCGDFEMERKLAVNQRDGSELISGQNVDYKSDSEMIWALLNYFRSIDKTMIQGFHHLDQFENKRLTADDVSNGLKQAGLNVSLIRSRQLISKYVSRGGQIDKPGFMRFLTSLPK